MYSALITEFLTPRTLIEIVKRDRPTNIIRALLGEEKVATSELASEVIGDESGKSWRTDN